MASISGSRARGHSLRAKIIDSRTVGTGAILPENSYGWANKAPQGGPIFKSTRTNFRELEHAESHGPKKATRFATKIAYQNGAYAALQKVRSRCSDVTAVMYLFPGSGYVGGS